MRLIALLVVFAALLGCEKKEQPQMPEGFHKTDLKAYTLLREVKAGEKLELSMLKEGVMATATVQNDVLKEIMLTSADIDKYLGKPFKKDVKQGDFLEKELF